MKKVLFFLTTLTLLSLAWGGAVKAQQNLPYSYGFEDYDLTVDGWTAQISSVYSGFRPDAAHGESDYGFCFAWNEQNGFLVSPELSGTGAGVILSFYYKEYSDEYGDEEFYVGYTTDENETNPSNFIYGEITTASLSWQQYEISLPAGTKRIAIQYVFNNAYYLFLDDFTFVAPAGCVGPASINVTALTNSSISIGWPAGNANSWNVYLNGTITGDSPVSLNSYTFENLTEDENYTIGVSAVCGSEVSDVTTTTVLLCVPAPSSVDYSGITNVTFGGVNDNFTMSSDPAPYYYDHSSQIGGASPGGTVDMSIEYDSYYGYYTWVWVDWNQDHTFSDEECVYTYTDPISSGTLELSFNVPATVAPGNYRVRIQGADNDEKKDPCYTGEWSCLVDYTLHIGEGCLAPAGLTATNVTHEGATLTWSNPNEGGSYIIKRVDGNVETVIEDNHTTTSYPITGLDPQTDYTYRVYIKCNASDISDSAEVSFSTTAPATAVGDYWSDDFEGTSCEWELINGNQTNAWVWGTATNNGGTHSLYISKDGGSTNTYSGASTKVFAAKLLNFTDSKYTFEYDWNCYGEKNWDFLRVALVPASETLTAGEDYSTIESSGSNSLPTGWIALDGGGQLNESTSWQNKSVAINVAAGNYYLVLAWRNDVSAYDPPAAVDNVSITKIACEYLVEGVQVINSTVTTSTANVLWGASEATAWQVQTKAGDGEWTTLASSDVDFSLSGVKEIAYLRNLTPGTEYQVRVRANCGNEQYGAWSNVISFTTECAPRAVTNDNKFTANFDDMTGSTYPSENNLPICWNYINTCSYATYSLYPYVYWSINESNSGTNHLRFFSLASANYTYYNPKPQYAILPPMQDVSNLRIKFYARAYNSGTDYDATFKVGVLTNPNDASTFTEIATYTPATTTYELYTIPFNTYSGNGNYIAIMIDAAEVPASGDFHRMLFIDDITVEPIPECVVPTNLRTVSVAHDGATVKWAANLEESWNLKYHAQGENQWIEVNGLQDSTYTFTELNAETEYEWQVQAACGANLTSDWSSLGTFTTEAAPANGDVYELFSGDLEEGDYLIVYDGAAMNTTVSGDRLQYEEVAITNNVIETNNAAIVWHIAPSDNYWTIYNADANAYAASTGAKNKAQMLAGSNDDKAKWTVSGTSVYEFVNKQNTTNNVNANLRRNGTYGFACYATSTGGALSLYKKVDNTPSIALSTNSVEAPDAGIDGTITVTYNNIDLTNAPEVQFFAADGTTPATYNWLIADINNQNNVEYLIDANTGEARTAYFKVYGLDAQANDVYSELVTVSQAAYVAPPTPGTWVLTDLASITAQDTFVIVGTYQNYTYAMSNDKGTTAPPAPVSVTVVNNTLSAEPTNDIKWTVSGNATDGYTFYPNGSTSTWLYCTNTNNGVRVGGTNNSKTFKISNGYLKHDGTSRYVGIYNGQDWRCYTSTTGNIENQTFAFYMKDDGAVATTVTIDATGLTNTDVYTSTAAGTLSATVSANDAAIAGATVTWSSSDENVATIDNSGVVTLVAEGTTTITASYAGVENEYRSSSATYELVVTNSDPSGTYEDPYTVVEAIDATPSTSWVYTRGIVSRFYGNNTSIDQDNSHRYYISDDGTTTSPEMLVYKGYGLNYQPLTSADALLVGDTVIIYGQLTVYNNTEEINKDNYIVYLGRPVMQYHVSAIAADDNTGSVSGTVGNDPFVSGDYAAGTQITLTATPAEGYDFSNWTKYAYPQGEEVSTNATYTFAVSEDINLIAYFTPKVYNVTYELGQGAWVNGYYAPVTYTYGEGVTLPTAQNMEYENHTFGGWYDNAQFTGTPITEISTTSMGDTTLFAKWTIDTYEIALVQPANGTISSDPAQTAAVGTQVILTATPNEGYSFDAWEVRNTTTGQTVDVVNNQFTMPAGNVEVHASFTAIEYTVTATANPAAGGTVSGAGTYSYEGAASLTASANNGYEFVNWTNEQGAVVCTTATYNFIVTRDSALTANFALKEYTITMSVVTGGTLSHNLPANVATMGTEVTLIATPDEGYQFDGDWTVQNISASSPVTVENNKFTMPAGNVTVTGYFSPITYTVSAVVSPANAGEVTGTGSYNHGDGVQLTANPAAGYEFVNWTNAQGAVVSTDADYNFIVNRDSALTANFELKEYTITMVQPNVGGTLSHNLPANVATMGTEVTLIATPNEGFQFDGDWTVQNTSASSPVTVENNKFTMPAGNVTVTGYFSYITYTVSAVVSPANAGSVTGTGSFNHGAEVQLTANPATGYEFVNWTNAQGAVVCTTATYNFNVTSDSALTANFALKEYTITYMDGNTELHKDTFAFGATVTPYADPTKECVEFMGWNETIPATMPANDVVLYAQWQDLYYNLTANVTPANAGNVTLDPQPATGTTAANSGYVCNTQVTLTATPEQEFVFVGWSVNGNIISADAQLVVSVTSDTTIEAQFEAKQKVATPTFTPVAGTYTEPKTVTIACATPGAVIYYTTDGTEPTANSTQYTDGFELNANTTVKAIAMKDGNDWLPSDVATAEYIFNFPHYTVTFIPGTNGTVTKDTMMGNAFTHPVDFTNNSAVPAADCQTLGWSFVGWSTAAVQETTTAPTTLVTSPYSPTDNITLYAVYQQDNNAAVSSSVDFSTMGYSNQTAVTTVDINNTTTATFAKANGSTAPTYYTSGTAVRCYAKNTITISSQSAMTGITFTFGSDDGQNAITADEGAYSNGVWTGNATSVTFTIGGANGNRRIATITVNQGGTVTTYNSDPDCIITYPIELATVQNGTIGADKTEAAEGETVTLNATPATGYHFGRWNVTKTATTSVENVTVTNNTFEMPASAVTVSADFWIDTLIILATPNPANGGTVTGEDEYEYGTQVTLTATPANDYYFTGWTSNGTQVSTDATFTFTATQDSDLVANFEAKQLVATPTFTPAAGSYTEPQTVTINCATQGATIYYTTDGTEPTANSTQYTDGFTLNANTTVKAIAVKDGEQWLPSEVATAAYTFNFPTYTVTFNPGNNGTVPEATMTGNQFTEPVDFTNNVPSPAAACTDWTFAGWSTAEVTETTTEPTFVTSPYNPSADITLYAVYQKTEQGTGAATPARYVKVTSAPNDWSGDYLIVCEGIWVAFDGSRSSLDANNNTIDVEINNGVIDSTATTGAAKFTIASMNTTTGYSIKSASGKYIGSTSTNKNELLSSTTTQYSNTISIDNGNAFIKGTSRYLRYNGTDGRFRYYTSSSQQDIQLYKYEPATAATVTTYNSNPVCSYMVYVDGNMQNGTVIIDPATATTDGALIGSTVTLTATPNQGYHFGYWQVSTDATYTNPVTVTNNSFEMPTSDVYVNAIFWIDTLHITATVNPAQTGSVDPSEAYVIYGDQVTLTATPAQDYLFENWTSNGQPVATDAVITITATQDSALVANFIQMDQVATPIFTSNPEGNTFTTEDVVTVTITTTTPNATIYYTMDGTDPVVPAGRNVTGTQVYEGPITLTETTTLKAVAAAENMINSEIATATYTINQMYYVDVDNSIEHGTVTADPEKGIENTQISLTAVPEEGYIFKAWNVYNANDADQTVTVTNNQFNMPAYDVMVSATFVPDTFTVTFVLNGAQFVAGYTPISRYWYKQQDANLPTAADMEYEGHSFDGWYENANFDGNSWTSVPDTAKSNKTYYAKWNVNNYGLTINYVDFNGQTVHESYSQSLDYGTGYAVASPAVDTYMPELDTVKGTMGTEAVTVNVRYAQVQMLNIDNVTVCTGETTQEINYELIPFFMEYFSGMRQGFETVIDGPMSITAGSNGIAAFTAVNDGTEPLTNTITVTPHDTLGGHTVKGVPQTFTITVNPKNVSEFSEIACDSYTWTAADTTIVDEGENDYVHVFQNQYGCDSTVTLHLNLHKTPTVVVAVDKAYYCTTENVTLNSTGSSTGSEYTYAWTGPNNYESTETNPVLASPLTGEMSGTYQLTVTHTATGCVSEPASVEVVVNTPGTPGYLFTITTQGDAYANIDGSLDEVTPVFATPEVNHFLDGANVNYTVVNNAENSYNAVGDYTITWTATDECGNEATTTQVLHVTQNVCPVATDADNNTYPSVQLAGKCWMAKNLRTTKYSDGRAVNNLMVYDNIMYPNTTENLSRYGYLYDWDNAMDAQNGTVTPDANSHVQGVCPTGWRIPNHNDFMDIAGSNSATDMYDLRYNQYWLDGGGNNSTNYSLLPGGCYNDNTGRYENLLGNAYLWGVNPASPSQPRAYWADCKCYMWQVSDTTNGMGHSVRCIKD